MDKYISVDGDGFTQEEFEDIKNCLEMLLSIREGAQPLARGLGIDFDNIVGYPCDVARNILSLEIIEKVKTYEPRVEVESIDFSGNEDGQLIPEIHFKKAEG